MGVVPTPIVQPQPLEPPNVTDDYTIAFTDPDSDGVIRFLCDERQFSRDRVGDALVRAFPPARLF